MVTLQTFNFHWLLQDRTIPELEKMIQSNEYHFKVKRLGEYIISNECPRDTAFASYIDKKGKKYCIYRVDK